MKKKIIYGIMVIGLFVSYPLTQLLLNSGQRYQMLRYSHDNMPARNVIRMDTRTGELEMGIVMTEKVKWKKIEDISD